MSIFFKSFGGNSKDAKLGKSRKVPEPLLLLDVVVEGQRHDGALVVEATEEECEVRDRVRD